MQVRRLCYHLVGRREFRRQLAQHPNNVRFEELQRPLASHRWTLDQSRGSHFGLRRGTDRTLLPFQRPHVLAFYVRIVLERTGEDDE